MAHRIDPWLEKVYQARDAGEVGAHYDAWAADYERDLMAAGYRYPPVGAALIARHVPRAARILDGGCGTGLMGEALAAAGYGDLVGLDLSDGMLSVARAKGCYGEVIQGALGETIEGIADASLDACISFGVLTPGHAPPESLIGMLRATKPSGVLAFSLSGPAWQDGGFREMVERLEGEGAGAELDRSDWFRVMPYSESEGTLKGRIHVYRKSS